MKSNIVRIKSFIACLCTVIMSVFAVTGCSETENDQNEMPAGDSSIESTGEYSSEHSEAPVESSSTHSEASVESSSTESNSTSSNDKYQPYEEILVDQQFLDSVEQDILDVSIGLYMDVDALRDEYKKIYPNSDFAGDRWINFLCNRGEQIAKEFLSDYDIAYEDVNVRELTLFIYGEIDKSVISSMLDDPRIVAIVCFLGEPPKLEEF